MKLDFETLLHLYSYKLYNIVDRHMRKLDSEEDYNKTISKIFIMI